jgi:hypothetical protein
MNFNKSNFFTGLLLVSFFCVFGCTQKAQTIKPEIPLETKSTDEKITKIQNPAKVIHVLVALCDNENQGIVPVPARLGDGEDTKGNLYWGAAYGVKTYFSKSAKWEKVAEFENPKENVLQRIVFKYKNKDVYFVADAYRGSKMKETIDDFFAAVSGAKLENVKVKNENLQIFGSANLVAFVGHNGLMDFDLDNQPEKQDDAKREAIILACASKQYFTKPLQKTSATPLLWTSNLMAPESYILHDALEGWINGETDEQVRTRAANAYSKYQKISLRSAKNLLVTGW